MKVATTGHSGVADAGHVLELGEFLGVLTVGLSCSGTLFAGIGSRQWRSACRSSLLGGRRLRLYREYGTARVFARYGCFSLSHPWLVARCSGERSQWYYCTRVPTISIHHETMISCTLRRRSPWFHGPPLLPESLMKLCTFLLARAHFSPVRVSPKSHPWPHSG
jgi:hypothetical protein